MLSSSVSSLAVKKFSLRLPIIESYLTYLPLQKSCCPAAETLSSNLRICNWLWWLFGCLCCFCFHVSMSCVSSLCISFHLGSIPENSSHDNWDWHAAVGGNERLVITTNLIHSSTIAGTWTIGVALLPCTASQVCHCYCSTTACVVQETYVYIKKSNAGSLNWGVQRSFDRNSWRIW